MLLRGDARIPMPPRVFDLLLVLIENAGRLVSKETLLNRIWADSFVEEGNLNQTVSRLRKLLCESPNENRFIETVPRVGYRFIANVVVVDDVAPATQVVTEPIDAPLDVGPRRRPMWMWAVVPVLLLLAVGGFFAYRYITPRIGVAETTRPQKHTPVQLTNYPTREERPVFTRDGSIRFARWEGSTPLSFIMGANGTDQRRDTSIAGLKTGAWSPDGRKVLYYKEGDSESIYIADANGSNESKLPFVAGNMDWSADSTRIVYQFGRASSDIFIYTLETGTSEVVVNGPAFESDPSFSPDGNSIVFVSDRDGNPEIYIVDLNNPTNIRRLTNHPAHDEFPTFSPDGTQIAFDSNREDENFDVYVMNADGTGIRRITSWKTDEEVRPGCWSPDGTQLLFTSNKEGKGDIYKIDIEPFAPTELYSVSGVDVQYPVYSPDGSRLAYMSVKDDASGELHIVDVATKRDKVLVTSELAEMSPRFSPDGQWIVFQHRINGNAEICVIGVDGGEVRNLTNNPARDMHPAWSPDGSKIVFVSNREGNFDIFSIYTMNPDGSEQHRIYYTYAISMNPTWSPDGTQIVFVNDKEDGRTGNFEIFAIEPETVNPERRLTFRRHYDVEPVFSPDGKRIAFTSNTDGNFEIYVMNSDGSGLLRITRNPGDDSGPSWSPDGKKLVFSGNRSGKYAIYEVTID